MSQTVSTPESNFQINKYITWLPPTLELFLIALRVKKIHSFKHNSQCFYELPSPQSWYYHNHIWQLEVPWGGNHHPAVHHPAFSPAHNVLLFCNKVTPPLRESNGTALQYSCLENPMDWGAWWAAVHGVAQSGTRLSNFTFTFHSHALEKVTATNSSVLAWRIPGMGNLVGCHLWGPTESDTTEVT